MIKRIIYVISVLLSIVSMTVCAGDKIRVYNGSGTPLFVTTVLYTTKAHKNFHNEQDLDKVNVFTVMSGNWVDIDRPKLSFNVDRDIWFETYRAKDLAVALEHETLSYTGVGNYVNFLNVGSSVKEVYIDRGSSANQKPIAYTSRAAFEKGSGKKWESIAAQYERVPAGPYKGAKAFMETASTFIKKHAAD